MTNKEITSVAIKAFAIYVLVQAILSVPMLTSVATTYLYNEYRETGQFLLWLVGAASFIFLLIVVVLLWKLANTVVSQTSEETTDGRPTSIDAHFLISLLGLYLSIDGLLRFGYACLSAFTLIQETDLPGQAIGYIIIALVQVLIGITLIIKAEGWLSLINSLRTAGLKGKE